MQKKEKSKQSKAFLLSHLKFTLNKTDEANYNEFNTFINLLSNFEVGLIDVFLVLSSIENFVVLYQ